MKIILRINSREPGNYSTKEVIIKSNVNIIPKKGETITFKGAYYQVLNVNHNFDDNCINLTVI